MFPLKGSFLSAALGCSDAPKKNTDPEQQRAANDHLDNGVDELATHESVADEGDGNEFASNDYVGKISGHGEIGNEKGKGDASPTKRRSEAGRKPRCGGQC